MQYVKGKVHNREVMHVNLCFQTDEVFFLQLHISSILDLSPFPVLGLHLLMSHPVRLMCVVSSAEDESAIRKVAELNGITTAQLQCVTDTQLQEILDGGSAQFDVIMAHLLDPSGELKETVFSMMPTLKYEYIDSSSVNDLLTSSLYRPVSTLTSFMTDADFSILCAFIVGPANQTGCIILRVGNLAD
jgi:hypothetical protein